MNALNHPKQVCPKCNGTGRYFNYGHCFRCSGTGRINAPAPAAKLPPMSGVIGLLNRAKSAGLKFPKLWLQLPDGSDLRLTVAGERSKYTGSVMLTDGKPYGQSKYFGRITPEGALTLGRDGEAVKSELVALLSEVATDPVAVAKRYAKLTGHCMFCSLALTDARSTAMGYGPICAKHWGLPWGEARADAVPLAEEAAAQSGGPQYRNAVELLKEVKATTEVWPDPGELAEDRWNEMQGAA